MAIRWMLKHLQSFSKLPNNYFNNILSALLMFSRKVQSAKRNWNFRLYPPCILTHQIQWFRGQCSPFKMMQNFLRFSCRCNIIPHNFDNASNRIIAAAGWKRFFWFFTVAVGFYLRGIFFLSLPFFGVVKLQRVGDLVGLEELNMAIYVVIASIVPIAFVLLWLFAQQADEIAALYNSYFLLDTRVSVRHLGGKGLLESSMRESVIDMIAFAVMPPIGVIVALVLGFIGIHMPSCSLLLSGLICSHMTKQTSALTPCHVSLLLLDMALVFYMCNLLVASALVVYTVGQGVLGALKYANEGKLRNAEARKLYPQLRILINWINSFIGSSVTWMSHAILLWVSVTGNCTIKLALKDGSIPKICFYSIALLACVTTFMGYFTLSRAAEHYKQSFLLVSSWSVRKMGRRRQKRRRERTLRDRRPIRRRPYMPISWDMGWFFRVEPGAALDFLKAVVDHTFDALVLF